MSAPKSLREQMRAMLARDRLDDGEYERFRRLLDAAPRRHARPAARRLTAAAAVILLGVAVAAGHLMQRWPGAAAHAPQRVAEEVFTNHVKVYRADLESASLDEVRAYFVRLDFSPVTPALLVPGERLLGARYCTLLGRIAAQLKYHGADGELITYYQAAYDPERFGALPVLERRQAPLEMVKHGVLIRLWVEQDVVVAQARTVDPSLPNP